MSLPVPSSASSAGLPAQDIFWSKVPGTAGPRRRGLPRVHANVPIQVAGLEDGQLTAASNDVSLGGLQITCDRLTASKLRLGPVQSANGKARQPVYSVSLLLDVDGLSLRVNAHACVAHLTLVPSVPPDQEVAVGLKFLDFEKGGKQALMRFIEHHMRPTGD